MKVVIELIGNESVNELLATSNFLKELAGHGEPKTEREVTEHKTDLDKLADKVAEATKVKTDEKVEEPKTRRRPAKPAPIEEPAKVEAPAKVEEPAPIEEPAKVEAPAPTEGTNLSYTIDDCKSWAMKALNAKKRPIVQEAFESVGATSFPTLKPDMFNDFVEYISSRL